MSKKFTVLAAIGVALAVPNAFAQQLQSANEVQVQAQPTGEADMIDPFPGCKPKVKPNCQARIVCTGEASIHGNNPRAIQVAKKIATSNANAELARYLGNKTKVLKDIKQLDQVYGTQSGAGDQTKTQLGDLASQVTSSSAEHFLQGVSVIGGKVDVDAGAVTVVIGQSCDTVATAQGISQKMQQGQAQQSGGTVAGNASSEVMGGPQVHYGKAGSVVQRPTNDF